MRLGYSQWTKSNECVFVNSALKIQYCIVKNTLLQTAVSAILPTWLLLSMNVDETKCLCWSAHETITLVFCSRSGTFLQVVFCLLWTKKDSFLFH